MLSEAREVGYLSDIDCVLADMIVGDKNDELAKAFVSTLSKCFREGHLCVRCDGGVLDPSPEDVWFADVPGLPSEQMRSFVRNLSTYRLPDDYVVDVKNAPNNPLKPICRYEDCYYFQKSWVFETLFLTHYKRVSQAIPKLNLNQEIVEKAVTEQKTSGRFNEEQAQAVLNGCLNAFTIICGGPGTGKTYTAGYLIKLFLSLVERPCEIALAAPTGKAASNLQKSLQNALDGVETTTKTLHSLLGVKGQRMKTNQQLTADLILVDESSMIDARMMAHLFASVKTGARLILLGDPYQLPPVESGAFFSDLIKLSEGVTSLKKCLRAELQEMISFAENVNKGDVSAVLTSMNNNGPIKRLGVESQSRLLKEIMSNIPNPNPSEMAPEKVLEAYQSYRVLSPLRRGPYGVDEINRQLFQLRRQKGSLTEPIMIVQNDYRIGLYNGEVGVIVYDKNGSYALFSDGVNIRQIPSVLLPKFEYAYCLSVHKSQGSEFDHVLLLMPEGAEVFGREVLYTAVTRAKKGLEIWGMDSVLQSTLKRCHHRLSGIMYRQGV